MNPTIMLILQKNSADIEAIVNKIGVGTLISLTPYFLRIAATLQAPPQQAAQNLQFPAQK
jgi:hypothetical protein